jgi:uncharacterized membrane protein YphA (DoxX/SURF4 family)
MNNLDWFAQILLAGIFLFAGLSKIFALSQRTTALQTGPSLRGVGLPRLQACAIALAEIAAALALVVPFNLQHPNFLPLLAASGLALLTLAACIYHQRRHEFTAPVVALFLLALFVVVAHA